MQKREPRPVVGPTDLERIGAAFQTIYHHDPRAYMNIHCYHEEDGEPLVSIQATINGERRATEQRDLAEALNHIAGSVSRKMCTKCGFVKPMNQFCKNRSAPDGHGARCKQCERERMLAFKRSKRARIARDAAKSGPDPVPTA